MTTHTGLVDAPLRTVSATLTEREPFGGTGVLAPGDEISLLHSQLRVAHVGLDGLRLVPIGRRRLALEVTLAEDRGRVAVTCVATGARRLPNLHHRLVGIVDTIRTRAVAMVGGEVIVGAAIVRDRTLLTQQRAYPPATAGKWELPGGRVEPGESDVDAVARECAEELGVTVCVGTAIGPDVALPGHRVLRVYRATLAEPTATPHPHDHHSLRWLSAGRLGHVSWLPADRVLIPTLRRLL